MNIDQLIEKTNSFEEFRIQSGLTTDEALEVLKTKLRELKNKK